MDALFQFGIRITQALQTFSPALDGFMGAVSFLGRVEFYLVLIPFVYWTIDRRIGVRAFLILLYVDIVNISLKLFLHQPRPYWLGGVKQLAIEPSYGIPSTHASDSIATYGYFTTRIKENWARVLISVVIFLIGLSRLYLAAHFPQDVLVGWLMGFAVLWAITKWDEKVGNWFRSKSLSFQIGLGFAESILTIIVGLSIRLFISGTPDPASWSSFSADARSVANFFTLGGALFGAISGYALMPHYARFEPTGAWNMRILRYVVGVIGLLVLYYGLDTLFAAITPDETILGYTLRYIRYGFVTFWVTFLAPWIFIKFKLAGSEG